MTLSKSSGSLNFKSNLPSSNSTSRVEINQIPDESSNDQSNSPSLEIYHEEVGSLNDLASFISYSSRQPTQSYLPIRDEFANNTFLISSAETPKYHHNISYVNIEKNETLDVHVLQTLQNGFTFACILNENEPMQTHCLLNIRLESNKSTLIWSKPAWDITNAWISPPINTASNVTSPTSDTGKASNSQSESKDGVQSEPTQNQLACAEKRRLSKARASMINNSMLISLDNPALSFQSKSRESFFHKKLNVPKLNSKLMRHSKFKITQNRRKATLSFTENLNNQQKKPLDFNNEQNNK